MYSDDCHMFPPLELVVFGKNCHLSWRAPSQCIIIEGQADSDGFPFLAAQEQGSLESSVSPGQENS